MMSAMSESNSGAAEAPSGSEAGVLANLPRTRPQRSSPRRAAARRAAQREDQSDAAAPIARSAAGAPATPRRTSRRRAAAKPTAVKRALAPAVRARRAPAEPAMVPRQGYESAEEAATGPVPAPGGPELFVSAVEIVGELAKSGITTGERLIKDALSRFSRP
jgi:hypothetical protein